MMWGVMDDFEVIIFFDNVKELIDDGRNIMYVFGFNEFDVLNDWGGSDV